LHCNSVELKQKERRSPMSVVDSWVRSERRESKLSRLLASIRATSVGIEVKSETTSNETNSSFGNGQRHGK